MNSPMSNIVNFYRILSVGIVFVLAVSVGACATEQQVAPDKGEVTTAEKKGPASTNDKPAIKKTDKKKADKKSVAKKQVKSKQRQLTITPNKFNRLLNRTTKKNENPEDDGIHDPLNEATLYLQTPLEAFAQLPKKKLGNKVDWVTAIDTKKIQPRYELNNPKAIPVVIDLNIVMQVKSSMPDVVFPHKQHTQWLDCSNCHPAIFIPQAGANSITMAENLLGKKCGVCHGKVAFPLSRCSACHSAKTKKVVSLKK